MYTPITPLKEADRTLESSELAALHQVWSERKEALQQSGWFTPFMVKLQREWAIETGIIEGLYSWDRGVTEVLIEQGIEADLIPHTSGANRDTAENTYQIISDQLAIVEGLFPYVKDQQPLSEHFIRSLQAQFTAHQHSVEAINGNGCLHQVEIERGTYKTLPNNPKRLDGETHEYCPPLQVTDEMQRLLAYYHEYESCFSPELVSAWLHHRFTRIHPFQDGNGRVARTLASLVFLKHGLFPVIIRNTDRNDYIASLEKADSGELAPLIALFVTAQKRSILAAVGLEQQVQQQQRQQVLSSAIKVLKNRHSAKSREVEAVYTYAADLHLYTLNYIQQIADQLNTELPPLTPPNQDNTYYASFKAEDNDSKQKHYYYGQIIEIAKQLGYSVNLNGYRSWLRLKIATEHHFGFIVSLHGYGPARNGVLAASGFTLQWVRDDQEQRHYKWSDVRPCVTDVFQFNYAESLDNIKQRFEPWLESACITALSEWKRRIEV